MTPLPGKASKWPILIASRHRSWLDYLRLDVRLRLRITAKRHTRGTYLRPKTIGDEEAEAWIAGRARKYGAWTWTRSGWIKATNRV